MATKVKKFREQLRDSRLKLGMQQAELAEILHVVPPYISRMERGASTPSAELLLDMCRVLGWEFGVMWLIVQIETAHDPNVRQRLIDDVYLPLYAGKANG